MTTLLDKFHSLPAAVFREETARLGIRPLGAVTEQIISPTEAIVDGHRVILAGTNNYLGLTFEQEAIKAAQDALNNQGTGTTGSRMANGTFAEHVALEEEMAAFFRRKHAIVFSTGFSATCGVSATLAGPEDVIMMDSDSHASIYDGVRLSGAEILRFRHSDPSDLDKRLRRLGDRSSRTLVIVEGIYSMLGDISPLKEVAALKEKYGFCLMVDEAHSMGVLGTHGRGLAEAMDVEDAVDFVVGTFSKSLGSIGGYCVSNCDELEAIRFSIRPYIFTASSTPAMIASTRVALRHLEHRTELREALWRNAAQLYDGFEALGFRLGPRIDGLGDQRSPVVAVVLEDREFALKSWQKLLEKGVYVNMVVPPASPSTFSLLRCSVSAAHSTEQIQKIIDTFDDVLNG